MESHLQTLCEELRKSIEVEVLVASDRWRSERSTLGGVEVVRLATTLMLHGTPIVPLMARAMRRARPDLVHLHFPNPMAALACLVSRLDVPIVVSWHSDVVRQRRAAAAFAPLLSVLLRRCAAIIVASTANVETSTVLRARRNLCRVIPYGIRAEVFEHPDPARVAELRKHYGERIVLGVGRLIYYKGFEHLVRAMADVRATALGALLRMDRLSVSDVEAALADPSPVVRRRACEASIGMEVEGVVAAHAWQIAPRSKLFKPEPRHLASQR